MSFVSLRRRLKRRGVLLIIVLSLLVLFALIGLTFVVVAGQYGQAARVQVLTAQTDDNGPELVHNVLLQVARGSSDPNSFMTDIDTVNPNFTKSHNLFEDLYGNTGSLRATVDAVDSTSYPGILGIQFSGPLPAANFIDRGDYYAGRVLTMLSGNCNLLSTRILKFDHTNDEFWVEAFEHETGLPVKPAAGDVLLVNGRPFSGIAGDAATGVFGDTNEDYDAPHANDPHLAFIPSNATQYSQILGSYMDRARPPFALDVNNDMRPDMLVDNDGDGILDSIWMDFGLAMKTAPNGVRYKPYAAVLILDMDGRANLNAHGALAQVAAINPNYNAASSDYWANNDNAFIYSASGQNDKNIRPRGMGVGPADVNLSSLITAANYQAFLQRRHTSQYGEMVAGINGTDTLSLLVNQGVPNDYATAPLGYRSWFDMHGAGMLGLNMRGQPIHAFMGAGQMTNSPYETNLVSLDGTDTPFSFGDLERILRWRDVDSSVLSRELSSVAPALLNSAAARRSVTTASFHIPVPAVPQHIIDRFAERLGENGVAYDDTVIRRMLAMELMRGGKMNINRFWGNGVDDNANGYIDEPGEWAAGQTIMADVYGGTAPQANYINGADAGLTSANGRHLFARNLFCLMMFLMEKDPSDNSRIKYRIPLAGAPFFLIESGITDDQHYELTVRRIAQWCINVVDFRDPDAIMTPFEYDINPFDGWHCDGIVTDDAGSPPVYVPDTADTRVVWGCEFPDVLMTESLAFHDRRVRDTEWDDYSDGANEDDHAAHGTTGQGSMRIHAMDPGDNSMPGDKDLDQVRIPQGSLFLEFYCTRARSTVNPVFPRELYDAGGNLDMARKDAATGVFPVWRVAISASHHTGSANTANSFQTRRATHPDSTSWDPFALSLLNGTDALPIERWVWFTNTAPIAGTHQELAGNTYYGKGGTALIPPGEYLVVGPRQVTHIGAKPTSSDATALPTGVTLDADQKIDLGAAGGIDYTDLDGASNYPLGPNVGAAQIAAPRTLYAQADAPGYPNAVSGLNVTEPLPTAANKYDAPTHMRNGVMDAYGDGTTAAYLDRPLDSRDNRPLSSTVDNLLDTQTVLNYKTAILQRLANPLLAFHPVTNPYITMDWTPIDVTIFNGEDREPDTWDGTTYGDFDPDETTPQTPKFGSRERASDRSGYLFWTPAIETGSLFTAAPQTPAESTATAGADECFQYDLENVAIGGGFFPGPREGMSNSTLGYLNTNFHGAPAATPTLGPLTDPAGDPPQTFAWVPWVNRPFVNRFELLLVPFTGQAELLHRVGGNQGNPFDTTFVFTVPYPHLFNFHDSATTNLTPHFYRLLDYVETPSRFVGTQKWYAHDAATHLPTYAPPFHHFSRFRDPGRINANTIPGSEVWTCVAENQFTSWANFQTSRNLPTGPDTLGRFTKPYRSAWTNATTSTAEQTYLRNSSVAFNPPLMTSRALSFLPHIDSSINAYFYYQGLTRQAAMLTTQSNVYAVWITVGYFEVNEQGQPNGAELGQDTGEVKRHRGFYIIDRSIPVAYERGRDHNVERAIRLQRYIE